MKAAQPIYQNTDIPEFLICPNLDGVVMSWKPKAR